MVTSRPGILVYSRGARITGKKWANVTDSDRCVGFFLADKIPRYFSGTDIPGLTLNRIDARQTIIEAGHEWRPFDY